MLQALFCSVFFHYEPRNVNLPLPIPNPSSFFFTEWDVHIAIKGFCFKMCYSTWKSVLRSKIKRWKWNLTLEKYCWFVSWWRPADRGIYRKSYAAQFSGSLVLEGPHCRTTLTTANTSSNVNHQHLQFILTSPHHHHVLLLVPGPTCHLSLRL